MALAGGWSTPLVLAQHVGVLGLLDVNALVLETVVHHWVIPAIQVAMISVNCAWLDHFRRHAGLAPLQFSNLGAVLSDGVPDSLHKLPFSR